MTQQVIIPSDVRSAMEGVIPAVVATSSSDGVPNITFISRLYKIDEAHVGLSYQFMNKTWRNLTENTACTAFITFADTMAMWKLKLQFVQEVKEGPVFEEMEMQLMALATPHHIDFSLHAALICRIVAVEPVFAGANI